MALRAVHGEAGERADRVRHHVVAVEVPREFAVGLRLRHLGVPDEIPRPRGDEAERLDPVGRAREQPVARDLFLDETRERLVRVQRPDHVVAVGPGVGPELVLIVTVRVAVVHDVEPVPRPTFTVAGRGEQPVHEPRVGVGRAVAGEGVQLLRRRRQTGEVEIQPPAQRAGVGPGSGPEADGAEFGADKGVDRVRGAGGRRRFRNRFQRPPVEGITHGGARGGGPVGPRVDPRLDERNLLRRERVALGRHLHVVDLARDEFHQRTGGALAGDDIGFAAFTTGQGDGFHVEPVAALLFFGPVALEAVLGEDRPDVGDKRRRRRVTERRERKQHKGGNEAFQGGGGQSGPQRPCLGRRTMAMSSLRYHRWADAGAVGPHVPIGPFRNDGRNESTRWGHRVPPSGITVPLKSGSGTAARSPSSRGPRVSTSRTGA